MSVVLLAERDSSLNLFFSKFSFWKS